MSNIPSLPPELNKQNKVLFAIFIVCALFVLFAGVLVSIGLVSFAVIIGLSAIVIYSLAAWRFQKNVAIFLHSIGVEEERFRKVLSDLWSKD